jgi:hypothetical protein
MSPPAGTGEIFPPLQLLDEVARQYERHLEMIVGM